MSARPRSASAASASSRSWPTSLDGSWLAGTRRRPSSRPLLCVRSQRAGADVASPRRPSSRCTRLPRQFGKQRCDARCAAANSGLVFCRPRPTSTGSRDDPQLRSARGRARPRACSRSRHGDDDRGGPDLTSVAGRSPTASACWPGPPGCRDPAGCESGTHPAVTAESRPRRKGGCAPRRGSGTSSTITSGTPRAWRTMTGTCASAALRPGSAAP